MRRFDHNAVDTTASAAEHALLAARVPAGHWMGELSSSALSTATAVCALQLFRQARPNTAAQLELSTLINRGSAWVRTRANDDGGWGDTVDSPSNISTTTLCWAALNVLRDDAVAPALRSAETWLLGRVRALTAPDLSRAIRWAYGQDRTFSVPILAMCAMCGRFGSGREAWRYIPALPFELAACPHRWFSRLGLPVVSYAIPALIAIGQARHHHRPTRNPLTRLLRNSTIERTLRKLSDIQPASGGFLEAAPLTSFVLMSLTSIGRGDHVVADQAARFLIDTVRPDGSWPIDTNLATFVTTLSIGALAVNGSSQLKESMGENGRDAVKAWLLQQQHRVEHPYTHAAPGGWAWTDLSGGVPDADDTPAALLALRALSPADGLVVGTDPAHAAVAEAMHNGVRWLVDLQNRDGGIPTFCRGWGKLPFDRSSPDLTAHTLRAWHAWRGHLPDDLRAASDRATQHAWRYLLDARQPDGVWLPLWFGNQSSEDLINPVYGTTRVLRAVSAAGRHLDGAWIEAVGSALGWLVDVQNEDGGWGGDRDTRSTIEETGLALEALTALVPGASGHAPAWSAVIDIPALAAAIRGGSAWLIEHTAQGTRYPAAPIGLYFAKLWYSEELYPIIFTVSALRRVQNVLERLPGAVSS